MVARVFNVLIGLWLFVSVFIWPHAGAQSTNIAICGILCAALALLSLAFEPARYLNAALGVWVFLSSFWLQETRGIVLWNDALCGIAIFASSLLGRPAAEVRSRREAPARA